MCWNSRSPLMIPAMERMLGFSIIQQSLASNGWGSALANNISRKADLNRGYGGYNTRWALFLLHHIFPLEVTFKKMSIWRKAEVTVKKMILGFFVFTNVGLQEDVNMERSSGHQREDHIRYAKQELATARGHESSLQDKALERDQGILGATGETNTIVQ